MKLLFVIVIAIVLLVLIHTLVYQNVVLKRQKKDIADDIIKYLANHVDAPILFFGTNGYLSIVNDYASTFFDIASAKDVKIQLADIFEVNNDVLSKSNIIKGVKCKKNEAVCDLSVSKIDDDYQEIAGYIVFVIDQTGQVEAMAKVQKSREIAEEANRAKSEFLANMSHEIRTPINAILGMNEMILRETKDRDLLKYASDIKLASNSLLSLVNDILDVSKIESGKMDITPVEYVTRDIFVEILTTMSFKAKEKGLSLLFNIDPKLPRVLYGDDVHIRQIINNLLSNAIKYTAKGQVIFNVEYVDTDDAEIEMHISVTDTGCGIKKEDIEKLFDAFTRVDEIHNRTIEGTGLGLKITHELLTMMSGTINVKSVYGKGSTFSCAFKQGVVNAKPIGDFEKYYEGYKNTSYIYGKSFEAEDASVLVVDDNQMNLNVVENLLKDTKMNIVTRLSGREAIKSARTTKYDLIFMDHMMPEMDGYEAFAAIREDATGLNKDTPIIAMTANAIAGARQAYIDYGFVDYIAKPIEPSKLEDIIIKYVDDSKIHYVNASISDISSGVENEQIRQIQNYLEEKGINVVAGLRNVNNKVNNYNEALQMFVNSHEATKNEMKDLIDTGKSKEYGILAHALKSNAKIIGADQFASICYMHEMCGKENRLYLAKQSWTEFTDKWHEIVDIIAEYLKEINLAREEVIDYEEGLSNIDEDELDKKISNIKELIDDYDHRGAKEEIELLMDYKLPDNVKAVVKEAYKYLQKIDYDNAAKVMERIG